VPASFDAAVAFSKSFSSPPIVSYHFADYELALGRFLYSVENGLSSGKFLKVRRHC